MKIRLSLEAKLALLISVIVLAVSGLAVLIARHAENFWQAWLFSIVLALPLALLLSRRLMAPINRYLRALMDGVASFRDGDFSVSIAAQRRDELGELAASYNEVGALLRNERQNLYQRELLLDTVIQSSPQALVLVNENGHVLYSNTAARQLFNQGRKLEGHRFAALLEQAPESLREAALAEVDGLYTIATATEPEVMHVTRSRFTLNTREHQLLQFKQLTRELTRQELETWKKVIRVISHELNNSLAPISSLAHSGRLIAKQPNPQRLDDIFSTIEERAARLKTFLEEYARFAKLPQPRPQEIEWNGFIASLRRTLAFTLIGEPPAQLANVDPAQLQQVLINLLKNAHEAGGPADDVAMQVRAQGEQWLLRVLDRGPGMSEGVLASALLPFYSTKSSGTGLGLTLCREIVEAHGGRLSLANREGGGLEVRIWLPQR